MSQQPLIPYETDEELARRLRMSANALRTSGVVLPLWRLELIAAEIEAVATILDPGDEEKKQ